MLFHFCSNVCKIPGAGDFPPRRECGTISARRVVSAAAFLDEKPQHLDDCLRDLREKSQIQTPQTLMAKGFAGDRDQFLHTQEVTGSSPAVSTTIEKSELRSHRDGVRISCFYRRCQGYVNHTPGAAPIWRGAAPGFLYSQQGGSGQIKSPRCDQRSFSRNRVRIAAASARVASPPGASAVAVRPVIRPSALAQRIASCAQALTSEASS